jgi:glycosyltransferase involved in cell wall biosynthesis
LKILFYHPWIYLKGGAEKVLVEYALRSKHDITIGTSFYDSKKTFKEFENLNIKIINGWTNVSVNRSFTNILKSFISICTINIENDYDLVVISSEGLGDFFGSFNPFFHKKKIAYVHTPLKIIYDPKLSKSIKSDLSKKNWYIYNILKPIYKILNKLIWKKYSDVVANSNEVKNRIKNNKLYKKKITVIHPGANIPDKYIEYDVNIKRIFLIPGRIMWQKRIEVVIEAFNNLKDKDKNIELVIMGTVDSKSEKYLATLKNKILYNSNVKILANPDDDTYHNMFLKSYCIIFSAECEDWGIVPIEAMSLGKPVIALNQCGPKESIVHKKSGYLINDFTPNAFINGINYMCSLSIKEYNKMSRFSYEHSKKFSWDEFTAKLDFIIEKNCKRLNRKEKNEND